MAKSKRLTVVVDDDLHHRAKVKAVAQGRMLSDIVRDALRAYVARKSARMSEGGEQDKTK